MGVLAAACGGGSSLGVASLGPTTTTSPSAALAPRGNSGSPAVQLRYVQCIQAHGIPNFPEPGPNTAAVMKAMKAIDLNSPQFQKAMHTCQKLIPKGAPLSPAESARVQAEALKFTNCMRANGEKNWPDPLPGGGYVAGAVGVAASSPGYQKAAKACHSLLPKG